MFYVCSVSLLAIYTRSFPFRSTSRLKRVGVGVVQLAIEWYRLGCKVYTKHYCAAYTRWKPYVNACYNVNGRYISIRYVIL